jgi:2'-5' RNA ligase
MKRLFAAIKVEPSEAFLSQYFSLKKSLQHEKIRWVKPDNLHITLKFFGETPEHHIPARIVALREAAKNIPPFSFSIQDMGVFGSSYKPKALWFGIEPKEEITALAGNIFEQLSRLGIEADRQNFVPHLTIARMNYIEDKKIFQQIIDKHKECYIQNEEVTKFHLFESILRPDGPVYGVVESFALDAGY